MHTSCKKKKKIAVVLTFNDPTKTLGKFIKYNVEINRSQWYEFKTFIELKSLV